MLAPHKLSSGKYCGDIVARRQVRDLLLTETVYAPGGRLSTHCHERGYFCLIRQGNYVEKYGNKSRSCEPGTLAFHPEGEVHSQHFGDSVVRSFNVELQGDRVVERNRLPALRQPIHFREGRVPWLARRLHEEFHSDDPFSDLAIEGLTLEMLAEIGRAAAPRKKTRPAPWLQLAREILHSRFTERLPLDDIASMVEVHPVYLATQFRRAYGQSIGNYQRQLRIEFACRELEKTQESMAAIALTAGFSDQAHFSRTFKRLKGVSPREYRSVCKTH